MLPVESAGKRAFPNSRLVLLFTPDWSKNGSSFVAIGHELLVLTMHVP